MASDFSVKVDIDMIPSLEGLSRADVPLLDIVQRTVQDIKKGISRGVTFHGRYYKKLSEKTIRDKKRTGSIYPTRALYRTGELFKGILSRKLRANAYEVYISGMGRPRRSIVAGYHQIEGVNRHTRAIREFFGMSLKRQRWARARVKRWVDNVINKAYLKKVKETRRY